MELFEGLMIVIAIFAVGFILGHAVANSYTKSYYKKRKDLFRNLQQARSAVGDALLPVFDSTIDDATELLGTLGSDLTTDEK